MNALRGAVSPSGLDWETYRVLAYKDGHIESYYESCFLHYMLHEGLPNGGDILCAFFYSKSRACEYYLGECKSYLSLKRRSILMSIHPAATEALTLLTTSAADNTPTSTSIPNTQDKKQKAETDELQPPSTSVPAAVVSDNTNATAPMEQPPTNTNVGPSTTTKFSWWAWRPW